MRKLARQALRDVERCDALIVGTPVYKASYAGILKHFFDFIGPLALVDRPVLLMATGGGYRHALVIEHQLRPLFGFFSARTVAHGVYAADTDFQDGLLVNEQVSQRLDASVDQFVRCYVARKWRFRCNLRTPYEPILFSDYGLP